MTYTVETIGDHPVPLAVFTLTGLDKVTAEYFSPAFQDEVESGLVFDYFQDRGLTVGDGKAFLDVLERTFRGSITTKIRKA